MEEGKELRTESERQGVKGKRREEGGDGKIKERISERLSKAEVIAKQRGRAGSLGTITELFQKRKREVIEEETAKAEKELLERFNESRRITRSPPSKIKKEEEGRQSMEAEAMLKEILKKMEEQERERKKDKEEIKDEIKSLKEELKRSEEEWERQRKDLSERVENLEKKVERIDMKGVKGKEGELMEKMKEIERSTEVAERRRRRNNVIMKKEGAGNEKEKKEKIDKLMEEIAKTKGIIRELQEIGYGRNKMWLFSCKTQEDKKDIMRNKKELGRKFGCFLDDDLTKEERRIQNEIRRIAREKKEKGKKITIGYQRIWEDNKEWRWNEREGRLEERDSFRRM